MPVFLIHVVACALMCGVIWEVQQIQYPMFKHIQSLPNNLFKTTVQFHVRRIQPIVGPAMLIEGITAGLLLVTEPIFLPKWSLMFNFAVYIFTIALTGLVFVPMFTRLQQEGWSESLVKRLCNLNWIRTVAWTTRLIVLVIVGLKSSVRVL
ncbi:MAG: hypothetical protein AAGI66_06975 [Cyanobacteria bacterium P01_H01_bin.74]